MKVFNLAKSKGIPPKEVLDKLKAMGIAVKTPVSVIPPADVERAINMFESRRLDEAKPVEPVVEVKKPEHVLKSAKMESVPAEGMDPRFNQYALGIRRRMINGKKDFSLLTFVFDPATLEIKLLKEEPKRNDAVAILDYKMAMFKRKVV